MVCSLCQSYEFDSDPFLGELLDDLTDLPVFRTTSEGIEPFLHKYTGNLFNLYFIVLFGAHAWFRVSLVLQIPKMRCFIVKISAFISLQVSLGSKITKTNTINSSWLKMTGRITHFRPMTTATIPITTSFSLDLLKQTNGHKSILLLLWRGYLPCSKDSTLQ